MPSDYIKEFFAVLYLTSLTVFLSVICLFVSLLAKIFASMDSLFFFCHHFCLFRRVCVSPFLYAFVPDVFAYLQFDLSVSFFNTKLLVSESDPDPCGL